MTPQFVDFDADGYRDLLMATFEGHVFVAAGSKVGFAKPKPIRDRGGDKIRISLYWDDEQDDYSSVDRSSEGETYHGDHHLTSVAAVDWDHDGDLDLLLGAYQGALYWCQNQGSRTEPLYATTNRYVMADGQHARIDGGLATPIVCDFNKDGLFDIVCGGAKGGVYLFVNTGQPGSPLFSGPRTLIQPAVGRTDTAATDGTQNDPPNDPYAGMMVPTRNGMPTCPGTSLHIDVLDYDSDGTLDVLVGGRSFFEQSSPTLSNQEKAELAEVETRMHELNEEFRALTAGKSAEELQALYKSEQFEELNQLMVPLWEAMEELNPAPRPAEFIWLYRGKSSLPQIPEQTVTINTNLASQASKSNPLNATGVGEHLTTPEPESEPAAVSVDCQFLPVEGNEATLKITIRVPDGYHIYGAKDSNVPTKVTFQYLAELVIKTPATVPDGEPVTQDGSVKYLLRNIVTMEQRFSLPEKFSAAQVRGRVDYMLCSASNCMPPATIEFTAELNRESE